MEEKEPDEVKEGREDEKREGDRGLVNRRRERSLEEEG